MDDKQFSILNQKIDILIGLLTQIILKDKTKKEVISILDTIGLENREIAKLIGSTAKSVSVRKAEKKQKGGK
jgi:HSP90 family molecular chaperone